MNTTGSVWQKWDLHIHTPASYEWRGQRFQGQTQEQNDVLCKSIVDKMNELDVVAFCIMDYWIFDGYITLREYLARHPDTLTKQIFPGIELRMAAPTDFRLNTHVLLSEEVSNESLGHFISQLRLADTGEKPPTRQHLIELGRSFDASKLNLYGCTVADKPNEEKMLLVGLKSALVTRESVNKAIDVVGKEHCIIIQPYDTNDGLEDLEWQCHPYTDSYLMKWADCFETRHPVQVDLFLGHGHKTKAHVGPQFIENLGGYPKPVFSGSDAHRIADYGVYPSNRATWIKAQPNFKGLKQVCHEPGLRCHIGSLPPKLEHVSSNKTKYMKNLNLSKINGSALTETWFDGASLDLNPGLIAIIGNKGSGKSALADSLALAGNSHCTKMEFLNDKRFRSTGNKAKHFLAILNWHAGPAVPVTLDRNADPLQPERVRYLPQHFIEDLCNEIATGNDTSFGKELGKVIFSHVSLEDEWGRFRSFKIISSARKRMRFSSSNKPYTLSMTLLFAMRLRPVKIH
jgi:energy-coupling factor transporter ATP-binding protein EcfA2